MNLRDLCGSVFRVNRAFAKRALYCFPNISHAAYFYIQSYNLIRRLSRRVHCRVEVYGVLPFLMCGQGRQPYFEPQRKAPGEARVDVEGFFSFSAYRSTSRRLYLVEILAV